MKQIIKLAKLNHSFTMANRNETAARAAKNEDQIDAAKSQVVITKEALDHHTNSKRLSNEIDKYMDRQDEVKAALAAAGYDTAVMDYFC